MGKTPANNSVDLEFELLNVDGELITASENSAISLEDVEPGVYYVHVYSDDYDAIVTNYSHALTVPYRQIILSSPTNVILESDSPYSISTSWHGVFGAIDYEVQRSRDGLTWTTTVSELTTLEWVEDDLEPNTNYYYRVGASFLNSEVPFWSSAVTITTLMEDDELAPNDSREEIDAQTARYSAGGFLGELTESVVYKGLAAHIGDEDWFAFSLTSQRVDATIIIEYDPSVAAPSLQLCDSNGTLLRSGASASGEVDYGTMTETSRSKRNWDYSSRQTSAGEIISYGNIWNASGSDETMNSFLDPWFDYAPVLTLYTEDYEFELNCKLTKSASGASPTINQHLITITLNREYKQVWQDPSQPNEQVYEVDALNPNVTLTSFSQRGNDVKYYIALSSIRSTPTSSTITVRIPIHIIPKRNFKPYTHYTY